MQYCVNHPEEISKLSKLKAQITEVKGIMMDNIDKVHVSCFVESNVGDKPIHV
jgi:vesicle-associated membrane protein 72